MEKTTQLSITKFSKINKIPIQILNYEINDKIFTLILYKNTNTIFTLDNQVFYKLLDDIKIKILSLAVLDSKLFITTSEKKLYKLVFEKMNGDKPEFTLKFLMNTKKNSEIMKSNDNIFYFKKNLDQKSENFKKLCEKFIEKNDETEKKVKRAKILDEKNNLRLCLVSGSSLMFFDEKPLASLNVSLSHVVDFSINKNYCVAICKQSFDVLYINLNEPNLKKSMVKAQSAKDFLFSIITLDDNKFICSSREELYLYENKEQIKTKKLIESTNEKILFIKNFPIISESLNLDLKLFFVGTTSSFYILDYNLDVIAHSETLKGNVNDFLVDEIFFKENKFCVKSKAIIGYEEAYSKMFKKPLNSNLNKNKNGIYDFVLELDI